MIRICFPRGFDYESKLPESTPKHPPLTFLFLRPLYYLLLLEGNGPLTGRDLMEDQAFCFKGPGM